MRALRGLLLPTLAPIALVGLLLGSARADEVDADLDELEQATASGDLGHAFARRHERVRRALEDQAAGRQVERLRLVDRDVAAGAGPLAARALADGQRTTVASAEARALIHTALVTCLRVDGRDSADEVARTFVEYDKLIVRAAKLDPASLRFTGELVGAMSTSDVPLDMALCEIRFAKLREHAASRRYSAR